MKNSALFRFAAALAAATSLFTALPAAAVIGGAVECPDSARTIGNPGYSDCRAISSGVVSGSSQDLANLTLFFGNTTGGGTFMFAGRSNDANAGPFQSNPGLVNHGTLQFDQPVTGFFALALQSADRNFYSYYLFDSNAFRGAAPSIDFDTDGLAGPNRTARPTPANLLFAGLFIQPSGPGTVPEPAGVALVLTALGALVLTKRRR